MLTRKILEASGFGPRTPYRFPISHCNNLNAKFMSQLVAETETEKHVDKDLVGIARNISHLGNTTIQSVLARMNNYYEFTLNTGDSITCELLETCVSAAYYITRGASKRNVLKLIFNIIEYVASGDPAESMTMYKLFIDFIMRTGRPDLVNSLDK